MPRKKKPVRDKREVPAWMNYGGIEPGRLRPMSEEKQYRRAVYDKLVEIGLRDYGIEPNYDDLPIPDIEPEDLVPADIRASFEYIFAARNDLNWQIGDLILAVFKRFKDKRKKLITLKDELGHDRVVRVRNQDIWAAVGYFSRYKSVVARDHARVCRDYPPGPKRERVRHLPFEHLKFLCRLPEDERREAEDYILGNDPKPTIGQLMERYTVRGLKDMASWRDNVY